MCLLRSGFLLIVCLALAVPGRGDPPAASKAAPPSTRPAAVDQYGDPLPPGARARLGSTRLRHGGQILFLLYAPDGKSLVSAAGDGIVSLWDTASKKERHQFKSRPMGAHSFAFSLDSKTLALIGDDFNIQFWDIASGKLMRQFPGPQTGFTNMAFSPDTKRLAVIYQDQTIKLWDTTRGQETASLLGPRPPNGNIQFNPSVVAFSPDGKVLAAGGQDGRSSAVRGWDVIAGNQILQFSLPRHGGIQTLTFSPDGKTLLVKDGNRVTYLMDAATGKQIRQQSGRSQFGLFSDAFSPDGKIFASVNGDQVLLEEPATGKAIRQINAGQAGVSTLAFSPDGQTLATGGINNLIRLWDVATAKEQPVPGGHQGALITVACSPDGQWAASTSMDRTIRVWEMATGKELKQFHRSGSPNPNEEPLLGLPMFSVDGKVLTAAWNDGLIQRWDPTCGKELGQFKDSNQKGGFASALTFSPDGKVLALGGPDGSIRLREVATGRLMRQFQGFTTPDPNGPWGGTPGATMLVYSRDGKALAMGGFEFSPLGMLNGAGMLPMIRLVELATGKERRRIRFKGNPFGDGDSPRPFRMNFFFNAGMMMNDWDTSSGSLSNGAFAPDGKTLAVAAGNVIHLWDLARGQTLRSFGSTASFSSSVAFSPDGRLLAAGAADGLVYLWDTATGTELVQQDGHRGPVLSLTFSPDGKALISGGTDTTVLVWDVAALQEHGRQRPPALSPEQLQALWKDLAAEDSTRADQAIWALAASPKQALAFLKPRLRPVALVDARQILRLILELEHDQFPVRQRASAELEKLGVLAETALRKALKETSSPEVHKRGEALLAKIEGPVTAPEALRASRVVEVLERIGTAEARQGLQRLASGAPEARLTRDAREALERLPTVAVVP